MPIKVERALARAATKHGFKGRQRARYIYGGLRRMGWKPKQELSALLDNIIQFKLYQPKKSDRAPEGDLPFSPGQTLDYVEQEHLAKRAGRHTDLRIGDRKGMYSWATKKDLPNHGQKIAIHPQPIHPHSYNDFEGEIPSGYGAGTVRSVHKGKAIVTSAEPGKLNYTVTTKRGDNRYAIINRGASRNHLLVRENAPKEPLALKPNYKSVPQEEAGPTLTSLSPGSKVQPKIDGALVYVTTADKPEVFSHRKSKTTGRNIVHTERFYGGRPRIKIPKQHQRTILAELYGEKNGKVIEPQELGGILNAHVHESLKRQRERGVKLKAMPFDIHGEKGSYPERYEQLKKTVSYLPRSKFVLPENADTPESAKKLFNKIRTGKHPLTKEGVIIHPPHGRGIKIKNMMEEDVKIHSVFPGKGKDKSQYGGFYYPDEKGNPLGKVGTGFTQETRRELPQYIGRTARVRHQGKYESGRLRAPSLIAIHENKD